MSTYMYHFGGLEALPVRLTDFDSECFFRLGDDDVEAIRQRFRSDRRAAGALQLLFLRACGRPMAPAVVRRCLVSAHSQRADAGCSHLEWLKTSPGRHGTSTLSVALEKIAYLKSLGVHEWSLASISLPKQHAYAQQVQARRPAKNRELKESRQAIELVCFLHVSLLELTDIAVQQSLRRSQQLFRRYTPPCSHTVPTSTPRACRQ